MLIQTRDYIREYGGDPRNLSLFGQESIGTTWSICKMNMLLHGIQHADIRQEDTIRGPQHKNENGELKRYDRVLANPPFSQNYIKKDIEYPGRFAVWMPEKGKKADLMFVQHMLAVLKADLRSVEKKQDELVAAAREKIDQDEARRVIIDRLHRVLVETYQSYLRADQRACLAALENLHAKYAVTAEDIERRRDAAAAKLKGFLEDLGYA